MIIYFIIIGFTAILIPFLGYFPSGVISFCFALIFSTWEFCVVISVVFGDATRQALVDDSYQSRAAGVERFSTWGLDPVGALLGGFIASSAHGLGRSLAIVSIGMTLSAIVAILSMGLHQIKDLLLNAN